MTTDSLGKSLRAGHCEIIPNHLDACSSCELLPGFPVFLVKGVLHGHHWIFPDEGFMQVGQLVGCDPLESSGDLKSRSDLLEPEELGGSHAHADDNLVRVVSLPNYILLQQLQSAYVLQDVRRKSALITHIGGTLLIFLLHDIL